MIRATQTTDGPSRVAVAYSSLEFRGSTVDLPMYSFIWNTENPNKPESTLRPPSSNVSLEYNPKVYKQFSSIGDSMKNLFHTTPPYIDNQLASIPDHQLQLLSIGLQKKHRTHTSLLEDATTVNWPFGIRERGRCRSRQRLSNLRIMILFTKSFGYKAKQEQNVSQDRQTDLRFGGTSGKLPVNQNFLRPRY